VAPEVAPQVASPAGPAVQRPSLLSVGTVVWLSSELMFFSDLAGQATYQNHPIHLDFIKNYSHLWSKVVV